MAVEDFSLEDNNPIVNKIADQAGLGDTPATLPEGTKISPVKLEAKDDEFVTAPEKLTTDVSVETKKASTDNLEVDAPTKPEYEDLQTVTTAEDVTDMDAVKGEVSSDAIIGDIQGTVSKEAIAKAATQDLDEKATVQYQLSELTKSLESGKPLPPWAAPAARAANAVMASRGLGASSMAAAAMTQSLMESAIPIAAADAQSYAAIQLANLNNEQQAALQNAATYAAMDRANLDARMTAAVNNAQAFLAIDVKNLDNEQAARTISYNAKIQAMFTDAAAENATAQLNAKNKIQVDQFFAELGTQTQISNKNRMAAMEQFNAGQENAMSQFVATVNNQREQFNQNMSVQIDQSNATWRREINTVNTAVQNEANRINAQNLLGLTSSAQNAMWQKYRDEASWTIMMTENEKSRAHAIGMLSMQSELNMAAYEKSVRDSASSALGGYAMKTVFDVAGSYGKKS